jgi:hypothetical protein
MFHAELISMSRGQSYDQVDILESRHGDFEKYGIQKPFGERTVAFFTQQGQLVLAHPWGVRVIHLDKKPRRGNNEKCFDFDRIILDGDISYQNGNYIDDGCFAELGVPDLFEDPGEVIDQVTFSCSQGVFITHDANVVSIFQHFPRGTRGVTKTVHVASVGELQKLVVPQPQAKIRRRKK